MGTNRNYGLTEADVTDERVYLNRRRFLSLSATAIGSLCAGMSLPGNAREILQGPALDRKPPPWLSDKLSVARAGDPSASESPTPFEYVAGYNNFYEFGTGKGDPKENAQEFVTDPWSVEVDGHAEITGKVNLEDILKPHELEERIYRLRCVEAWSMVVPWVGVPLASILKRFKPTSRAKYVRFETLLDPEQMPGQRSLFTAIDYPYVEGLRIDEAMNELSFMAVGLYGNALPPQNGAPLRLVVPWKYGFKSIKSIVKISFVEREPRTTWVQTNPREYGFFANVNPEVDHPRWSQATERRLPGSLFSSNRIDTKVFNGYGEQVASLYAGMDLSRYF